VDRILELYGIPEVLLAAITQLCCTYLKHLFKKLQDESSPAGRLLNAIVIIWFYYF